MGVQEDICEVVWDLFPSIAPYVPSAPQPATVQSDTRSDTQSDTQSGTLPKLKRRPLDPTALRCSYVTRSGTLVYRGRHIGSTRDVSYYWTAERVLRRRGLYLDLAIQKMGVSGFARLSRRHHHDGSAR